MPAFVSAHASGSPTSAHGRRRTRYARWVPVDLLVVRLGARASLDFVRRRADRLYLVVMAERADVGSRHVVALQYDEAVRVARFLATCEGAERLTIPLRPPCSAHFSRIPYDQCFEFSFQRSGPISTRWRCRLPFGEAVRVSAFLGAPPSPVDTSSEDDTPPPSG